MALRFSGWAIRRGKFFTGSPREADRYLQNRADKGFTVIQAVALAEFDGLHEPNAYGHKPLLDDDPTRPDVKEGPDNDYWDHVDTIVKKANDLGLTIGFLRRGATSGTRAPARGRRFSRRRTRRFTASGSDGATRTRASCGFSAATAGSKRHASRNHPRDGARLAQGRWGYAPHQPAPEWRRGIGGEFSQRAVAGFQHAAERARSRIHGPLRSHAAGLRSRAPKPNLDAEPIYEDHPVSFKREEIRALGRGGCAARSLLGLVGGAFGHTYGHHSVWQFFDAAKRGGVNNPLLSWTAAIDQPGAAQMQHARHLLESRPFLTRIPDDAVIVATDIRRRCPARARGTSRRRAMSRAATRWCMRRSGGLSAHAWM